MLIRRRVSGALLVVAMATALTFATPVVGPAPAAAACVPSTGPGIPPPSNVPSGFPVYGSSWYGQSGYMTLCAGGTSMATLGVYNSGSAGWGEASWKAYLGTWNPEPGQDKPSVLGGDGTNGSQNTGWPRYDRVAIQPVAYVGPNQVAWFQFQVRAPMTPGTIPSLSEAARRGTSPRRRERAVDARRRNLLADHRLGELEREFGRATRGSS
jgi:hypothetical protein